MRPLESTTTQPAGGLVGHLCLLITVIIWGGSFVATKVALRYLSPVELLALRLLIGLPALILVLALRRVKPKYQPGAWRALTLGSIVISIHWLIQITGMKYTSATNTGWIIAITPLIMAVASGIFLHEKLRRNLWLGVVFASLGVVLLISRGRIASLGWLSSVGDWLVLASAHTWVIYTIITRDLLRTHRPLLITATVLTPVTIVMLGYVALTSDLHHLVTLPSEGVIALLILGIGATAIAHWFWQEGVSRLGAARAGTFLYIEPLATTVVAVPMLNEYFGISTALGGGLVLLGVYLAQRRQRVTKVPG